ncbi:hypothetical protein NLX67_02535 [Domibacillus sp. A3M-37]|uniref:hypothetical protein n=1 Tax=Domibacillus sp. A3M-37 TaxID=2962037 RepID=UPI0020B6837F|nr:hypothetical protein [Domibacillus sp. A3M-37]MCP3761267.1 hypothetical protein [Domibacillus sp. A3M-37]
MEKPNESMESSLVFVNGRQEDCMIRFMTVYQEGLVIDAKFTKRAAPTEKEWSLGIKGAVKMIVSEKDSWQEIIIDYSLPEGYLHLTAVTALSLSKSVVLSIANQFFIRKGEAVQYLSTRALLEHAPIQCERFLTIRIPKS